MVAATRITVSLESSDEQQEVQEMGSVEATGKQCGYVFVSNKENICLPSYYYSISFLVLCPLF
jgi:hypothetical protein